jgi:hypothetical protein
MRNQSVRPFGALAAKQHIDHDHDHDHDHNMHCTFMENFNGYWKRMAEQRDEKMKMMPGMTRNVLLAKVTELKEMDLRKGQEMEVDRSKSLLGATDVVKAEAVQVEEDQEMDDWLVMNVCGEFDICNKLAQDCGLDFQTHPEMRVELVNWQNSDSSMLPLCTLH